jgi:hypothetical protein
VAVAATDLLLEFLLRAPLADGCVTARVFQLKDHRDPVHSALCIEEDSVGGVLDLDSALR